MKHLNDNTINKIRAEINVDCCTHANGSLCYRVGYIMLPCFKVALCMDCGDWQMVCSAGLAEFWEKYLKPLWNGNIIAYNEIISFGECTIAEIKKAFASTEDK